MEQQKAKVLEVQATIDRKIQEAEECKCQIKAEKAAKKAKKDKERQRKEGHVIIKATGKG